MKKVFYFWLAAVSLASLVVFGQTRSVIRVGSAPNDGAGEGLQTALIKVNSNESNLWNTVYTNAVISSVSNASISAASLTLSGTNYLYLRTPAVNAGTATTGKVLTLSATNGLADWASAASGVGVSVTSYGAVGNGTTDDTAAIQAAIEAAKLPYATSTVYDARSGLVLIPKGTYRITARLIVYPGIVIRGESQESVHIVPEQTGADCFYGETPDGTSSTMIRSYTFENLTITQKAGTTPTSGAAIHIRPTTITGTTPASTASRLYCRNVYIYGTFRGIWATALQGGQIANTSVFFCQETGVTLDAYQTLVHITSSASSGNGTAGTGHGWSLAGPAYVSMSAVSADSNAGYGYYLSNSSEQTSTVNDIECGAEGNYTGGLYLQNQVNTRVMAFVNARSGVVAEDGIVVDGSTSRVTLSNCNVPTQGSSTGYALRVTNGPTDGSASVTVMGGFFGLYGAGANIFTSTTPVNWMGYQSANRYGYGMVTTPLRPLEFDRRTYAVGTAGRELARYSDISTDNAGSTKWTITSDSGNAFGEFEQNSIVLAPFSYSSTFGDTIIRNSYTSSGGQYGNIKFVTGSTVSMTIGNGTRRGQVAIGNQTIDASAQFQVDSTTGGILLPRMTKAQRNAINSSSPTSGLLVYQTDGTVGVKAYIGGAWYTLNTTADP